MDSRWKHQAELGAAARQLLLCGLAALLALVPVLAFADDRTPGGSGTPRENSPTPVATVQSGPSGVTVYIRVTQQFPGTGGDPSSGSSVSTGGTRSCVISVSNIGIVLSQSSWYQQGLRDHPNHVLGSVRCDGGFFSSIWIPMGTPTGNVQVVIVDGDAVDPVTVALELLNHLPIPDIAIAANPSPGLVALPSWFWIDGYDGTAIVSSDSLGGLTVDVEVVPLHLRWAFGDGTSTETISLGQPYPAESDIQHVYERSSLGAGGAYIVAVEMTFAAQYRVNGGTWEPLDPITRSFTNAYPVQQLQSVLVGQEQ